MAGLLAQAARFLAQKFATLLQKLPRTQQGKPLAQVAPEQPVMARALFRAARQAGLQIIEPLQPFVEPAARMQPRQPLRQLGRAVRLAVQLSVAQLTKASAGFDQEPVTRKNALGDDFGGGAGRGGAKVRDK